jgi:hypothetical protein
LTKATIKNDLPKLMDVKSTGSTDIRITGWTKNGDKFYLLCYLGKGIIEAEAANKNYALSGQRITVITGS